MTDLDQRIKEALDDEDKVLMERLGEQGLIGQFGDLFKGKLAGITVLIIVFGLVFVGLGFYAAWQAYHAQDIHSVLMWGGLAWLFFTAQTMVKIWSWMRMETNRTLREIKRVELQLARLLEKS